VDIQARPYRDAMDLARMRHLLATGSQANIPASYMHPGYLDFDTHCPPDEPENQRDFRLWEGMDADEYQPTLEAWSMFWRNEAAFDVFVSSALYGTPAHEVVMDEYVAWAEERAHAAGLKQLSHFCIFDNDTVMKRLYQARGFVVIPADLPAPLFERSLDALPTIALPDGFTVQGVRNLDDGRLRARVTHAAFEPDGDWTATGRSMRNSSAQRSTTASMICSCVRPMAEVHLPVQSGSIG
jgi:hypothetical protein